MALPKKRPAVVTIAGPFDDGDGDHNGDSAAQGPAGRRVWFCVRGSSQPRSNSQINKNVLYCPSFPSQKPAVAVEKRGGLFKPTAAPPLQGRCSRNCYMLHGLKHFAYHGPVLNKKTPCDLFFTKSSQGGRRSQCAKKKRIAVLSSGNLDPDVYPTAGPCSNESLQRNLGLCRGLQYTRCTSSAVA